MDKKTNHIKKSKTLDISTTLFDNVAFVLFNVIETFSKDFLEVHGLRSRGFQLLLHKLQQRCGRNFEKKCTLYLLDDARNSRRRRLW